METRYRKAREQRSVVIPLKRAYVKDVLGQLVCTSSQETIMPIYVFPTLHSVTSPWQLETGHGGIIYTIEIGK